MSRDGIRPHQNLSAERGQAKQEICGLDEDGLDYDDDDETESLRSVVILRAKSKLPMTSKANKKMPKSSMKRKSPQLVKKHRSGRPAILLTPRLRKENSTGLGALCVLLPEQRKTRITVQRLKRRPRANHKYAPTITKLEMISRIRQINKNAWWRVTGGQR